MSGTMFSGSNPLIKHLLAALRGPTWLCFSSRFANVIALCATLHDSQDT